MESNFNLDFATLIIGVVVITLLYLLKAGVLPWLATKEELARKQIAELDTHFATTDSTLESVIQSVASKTIFTTASDVIVALAPVINSSLMTAHKILPDVPERISEQEVADVFNQVTGFVVKLTDDIAGNVLPPPAG